MYDAELQALLELCSLCAFVSNYRTDARSVCLAVCPVMFVLYLKARCDIDLDGSTKSRSAVGDFVAHFKQCDASLRGHGKGILRNSLHAYFTSKLNARILASWMGLISH